MSTYEEAVAAGKHLRERLAAWLSDDVAPTLDKLELNPDDLAASWRSVSALLRQTADEVDELIDLGDMSKRRAAAPRN